VRALRALPVRGRQDLEREARGDQQLARRVDDLDADAFAAERDNGFHEAMR